MASKVTTYSKFLPESVKAFGLAPSDLTSDGLAALATDTGNGLARFALAIYAATVAPESTRLSQADIVAATWLTKQRVSALTAAGELLSRCGETGTTVARQATAIGEALNKGDITKAFGTKSGPALVAAITKVEATMRAERNKRAANKRGAGKAPTGGATQPQPSATRKPADRIGAIADEIRKVNEVPRTKAVAGLATSILAHAIRIAHAAGVDVADVIAAYDAESVAADVDVADVA